MCVDVYRSMAFNEQNRLKKTRRNWSTSITQTYISFIQPSDLFLFWFKASDTHTHTQNILVNDICALRFFPFKFILLFFAFLNVHAIHLKPHFNDLFFMLFFFLSVSFSFALDNEIRVMMLKTEFNWMFRVCLICIESISSWSSGEWFIQFNRKRITNERRKKKRSITKHTFTSISGQIKEESRTVECVNCEKPTENKTRYDTTKDIDTYTHQPSTRVISVKINSDLHLRNWDSSCLFLCVAGIYHGSDDSSQHSYHILLVERGVFFSLLHSHSLIVLIRRFECYCFESVVESVWWVLWVHLLCNQQRKIKKTRTTFIELNEQIFKKNVCKIEKQTKRNWNRSRKKVYLIRQKCNRPKLVKYNKWKLSGTGACSLVVSYFRWRVRNRSSVCAWCFIVSTRRKF